MRTVAALVVVFVIAIAVLARSSNERESAGVPTPTTGAASPLSSTSTPDPQSNLPAPSSSTTQPAAAPAVPPSSRVEPAAFAAVAAEGSAPVIVSLTIDPVGSLDERRAQVDRELDRVLTSLPENSYRDVTRDLSVPTIPMTVEREALDVLATASAIESVRVSRTFHPVQSVPNPDAERKVAATGSISLPSSTNATTSMGADLAWGATPSRKGAGATIAVIDTGVDSTNPFLKNGGTSKIIAEGCFASTFGTYASPCSGGVPMSTTAVPSPGSAAPCPWGPAGVSCSHGTHVAGIAAGGTGTNPVSGIAPEASLVAVSVFSYSASTDSLGASDADIIRSIQWLLNRKASDFPDLVAVNLSLGGNTLYADFCPDDPLAPSVAALRTAGVATVAASGNDGRTSAVTSPGCIPDVITVGAVDDATGQSAVFSNDGPQVDVMAAGVDICSSLPSGTSGSFPCTLPGGGTGGFNSGTSMATPAVSGAIAVLKSASIPLADWLGRLQRVITGGDCVQASAYTIPYLRLDVALGITAQRAAPCAPSAPVATAIGVSTASISWRAPIAMGTGSLVSYTVSASSGQTCTVATTSCTIAGLPAPATITFTVTALSTSGTSGTSVATRALATGMMRPVTPARLADTRSRSSGASTIDGLYLSRGPIGAGSTYAIRVLGRGGVPSSGVGAVALNVTATNPSAASFLTVYPSGSSRPTASSLNFVGGQTVPNLVISGVGSDGAVAVFNALGSTDVVIDVVGWYPSGTGYQALQPARLLDTRGGLPTIDGQFSGIGAVPPGAALSLVVAGRGGVPANAGSVVLNVTATNPSTSGFLTVYPRGASRPTASNLNFVAMQTVPNAVISAIGDAGRIEIFNALGATDVVVDVVGWMPGGSEYTAMNPARILETRPGLSTIDGQYNGIGALAPGAALALPVTGRVGIPAGVHAVVVNVTATNPSLAGFLTVYSSASTRPIASNLNFVPGQTVPNLVITGVGQDGRIMIFNALGVTDVVVDVVGWYS